MNQAGYKLVLPALLFLSIARFWLMPLTSSLWVDEMGTVFVVRHGAQDPSLRAVPQVPASIYYVLPRLAERLFGSSEIAFRMPSVLALALALYLIGRIAGRLIHPAAGWFAVFACLSLRGFNYEAADARPYALGTLVAAAAFWFLIRWLDHVLWRDALLFALAASLLWRVHLVFWPVYAAFALYAAVRLWRGDTQAGWRRVITVFGLCALALLPVLYGALALYRNAGAHVIAPLPTVLDLMRSLKPGLLAACTAGAVLIGRASIRRLPSIGDSSLILGWWLLQPLSLFAFSWATSNSVFVHRYVDIALPGAALAATAAAFVFLPPARWRLASLILGIAVLLLVGDWSQLWPPHHNSGWRTAAERLNQLEPGLPVVCPSPFIEARVPVWQPDYPAAGFLYAHLEVYPLHGKLYAFPYNASPEAEQFAATLVTQTLAPAQRFAIYGTNYVLPAWRDWFAARPELAGWDNRSLGPFGDVDVVVFDRAPLRQM
jgi:mannosyltransferase